MMNTNYSGDSPLYIVKTGIYIQGISGPYSSRTEAISAFNAAYGAADPDDCNDFDGYHQYYLVSKLSSRPGEPLPEPELGELLSYGEKKS